MFTISGISQIEHTQNSLINALDRIATGTKTSSAKNNPSNYSITKRMEMQIASINRSNSNIQNSNAMLNVASGSLTNTLHILGRLREKTLAAMNGTNDKLDQRNLNKFVAEAIKQIDDNALVTYNNKYLLKEDNQQIIAKDDEYESISLLSMTSQSLNLTDENGNSLLDMTNPADALERIDQAIETTNIENNNLLEHITDIGSMQQSLSFQSENYTTMEMNTINALSTLDDTNIAEEITKLKSAETQNKLAIYAQKQLMNSESSLRRAALMNL